jgi:hypothetical protein
MLAQALDQAPQLRGEARRALRDAGLDLREHLGQPVEIEVDLAVLLQVLHGEVLECGRAGHRGLPSPPINFTRGARAVK